jgi:hypothetical protein
VREKRALRAFVEFISSGARSDVEVKQHKFAIAILKAMASEFTVEGACSWLEFQKVRLKRPI